MRKAVSQLQGWEKDQREKGRKGASLCSLKRSGRTADGISGGREKTPGEGRMIVLTAERGQYMCRRISNIT